MKNSELFANLFLVALTTVESRNVAEVKQSGGECGNILPFSQHFRYGYDVTHFNLYSCPDIAGKRSEIIELDHCLNGSKYRIDNSDAEYDLPDGMSSLLYNTIQRENSLVIDNFTQYYDHEIKPMLSFDDPKANEISKGLFVSSSIYAEIGYFSFNLKMGISQWKSSVARLKLPKLELKKHLTAQFKEDVSSLPTILRGNEQQFLDFIKKYGTHVMSQGTFGGLNTRDTVNFNNKTEDQFLIAIMKNSHNFMELKNASNQADCEKSDAIRSVMKISNYNASFVQYILGGETNKYRNISHQKWMDSVRHVPALLSAEMVAISDLIDDKEISHNLWDAIRIYVMNAYKNFNLYFLDAMLCKGYCGRNETAILKKKIEAMTEEDRYNVTFLEQLGDELRDECAYVSTYGKPKKPISLCYFKPCT